MQQHHIRPATAADLPTLMAFLQLKAQFDGCPESLTATADQLADALFGPNPMTHVIWVEVAGHPVGFASYYRTYSTFLARPGLWLDDLYVKATYRGQGLGKALIQHLCHIAQAQGCQRIDWFVDGENEPGIQFYEHMGGILSPGLRACRLDRAGIEHQVTLAGDQQGEGDAA